MSWSPEKVEATLASVLQRATTDAAFRALALADPAAAIAAVAGSRPPDHFKVRCIENAGAHLTLVLPDFQDAAGELADADLEKVAGGDRPGKHSFTRTIKPDGTCF